MKLTPHEEKILALVQSNPEIITDSNTREKVAKKHGLSEKTLRNRIADLKKYGYIGQENFPVRTKSSFSSKIHPDEINFLDYASIIWKWRKFIVVNVVAITFLAVIISLIMPKTYQSSVVLMPPSSETNKGILGKISDLPYGGLFSQTNDETMSMIAILKSRTVMENVIDNYNLVDYYQVENIEKALELLKDYTIFEVEDEGTIRIAVNVTTGWFHLEEDEERVKYLVADMANYFIEQADLLNKKLNIEKASFHRKFVGERYQQNISDLKNAEDSLKVFQEKHKMISLSEQTSAAIEAAATIKGQILANEIKLGVMGSTLNPGHPDIEKIKKENIELQKKLDELEYGPEIVHPNQNKLFPVFSEVPELGVQLLRLKREVEIQNTLFTFLTQQYEEAKIQEAKNTPTVQVLDEAKIPIEKYKPRRLLIVVSTFLFMLFINVIFVAVKTNHNKISI